MRYLRFLISAGVAILASQPSFGDKVYLKNGRVIEGVVTKGREEVSVELPSGILTILELREITRIEKTKAIDIVQKKSSGKQQKFFKDRNIGTLPISAIMPDIDAWFRAFESSHRKQKRKLVEAQKAVRLNKKKVVYAWGLEWVKKGFSAMALNDIHDTRSVLSELTDELEDDINKLKGGMCDKCDGTGYADCPKCQGKGKVERERDIRKYSPEKGKYIERRKMIGRCRACKGKSKILCDSPIHKAEKYAKGIGGLEKMVDVEIAAKKRKLALSTIHKEATGRKKKEQLQKLAERCYRERYYYIMLEILQLCDEQVK